MELMKSWVLIRYQFQTAFKTITRFRGHTVFSLAGLVIGLASVFVISSWTIQELRYDRFHHHPKRIFMVTTDVKDNAGHVNRFPETPAPLAAELAQQIPQIEHAFHFLYLYGGRSIGRGEITYEEAGLAATPEFFDVLNFKLLEGSATGLDQPNTILLSQRLAEKLFPGSDPINRELFYKEDQLMVVKGVFEDCPFNSSLQFDFVIPYESEYGISTNWWQLSDATFIKLMPDADPGKVSSLIREVWKEKINDDQFDIGMISIADLRYGADFEFFNAEHGQGDRNKLYLFMGVALLILVLASLNYLNLVSSHAIKREKEIWIRKVHGAGSGTISGHVILESVLLSILAWGLAALLSVLGIRLFEHLVGILISSSYLFTCIGYGLIISILIVGIAAGFYPAMQAGARALVSKKEVREPGFHFQNNLRKVFVGGQFTLSIALTISGLVVYRQAAYMKHFDTGYAPENIIEFKLSFDQDTLVNELKDWLRTYPDIENYSLAATSPVQLTVLNTLDQWSWSGLGESTRTSIFNIKADEEYLNVFHIPLVKGRFFLPSGTDHNKVVVNEKLAALMGFEDPVGQTITRGNNSYEVIGVVRDFNFQHLSNEIRPLLFLYVEKGKRLFVRMRSGAPSSTGQIMEKLTAITGQPVNFSFVDENLDMIYSGESQILAAVLFFTVLCIILSGLGLIGMVSHSTAARTRDMAIRKVFGAQTRSIMITQLEGILIMFIPGLVIGGTLSWFVMKRWLENYANRNGMDGWVFLLGPVIILVFALLSISFQIWKSSRRSPAVSLKHL